MRRAAGAGLAALLGLASPMALQAAPRQLAVLVGKALASLEAAVRGMARVPEVELRVFRLHEGTTEIDRAVAALRHYPFDGVVALGASAHEFFRSSGARLPYAATMVLGASDAEPDDRVVPFEATPADWLALFQRLFPEAHDFGAVATGEGEQARLEALRQVLAGAQRALVVQRVGPSSSLSASLRQLLARVQVFYFSRDRGLLEASTAREVLKAAHRARVPVVAFSRGLVRAGALASLDLSPELAGERAARTALGLATGHIRPALTLNRARARSLGLDVPAALLADAMEP